MASKWSSVLSLLLTATLCGQTRWSIVPDGGIAWDVKPGETHQDQIEMSGLKTSVILTYGVRQDGEAMVQPLVVFPSLRTIPNDTHASLSYDFSGDASPRIFLNGRPARNETVKRINLRGLVRMEETFGKPPDLGLVRTIFPSIDHPLVLERYVFTNRSASAVTVEVEDTTKLVRTNPARGVSGEYVLSARVVDPGCGPWALGLAPTSPSRLRLVRRRRPNSPSTPSERSAHAAIA